MKVDDFSTLPHIAEEIELFSRITNFHHAWPMLSQCLVKKNMNGRTWPKWQHVVTFPGFYTSWAADSPNVFLSRILACADPPNTPEAPLLGPP